MKLVKLLTLWSPFGGGAERRVVVRSFIVTARPRPGRVDADLSAARPKRRESAS